MTTEIPLYQGPPKREILRRAFSKIGLQDYEFSLTPEEITDALDELNAMMREHPFSLLVYNFSDYGSGRPEDISGIPDAHIGVVGDQLAIRIAPNNGKAISPDALRAMARSWMLFQSQMATIPTAKLAPNTVRGTGNQWWGISPFIRET